MRALSRVYMKTTAAFLFAASAFLIGTLRIDVASILARNAELRPFAALAQGASSDAEPGARIKRIENGLLPAATIKGQVVQTMNLTERMKHYNIPGVSIAFFENGKISWTRAYGFADVAGARPVTPETLFQSASISKPTAALGLLRLVQEGKLNLDEDVNLKLRSWKIPANEFTKEQKVTLRRILSHSAGMNIQRFPGYAAGEPLPTTVQILNGEKPANTVPIRVETVPGTIWRYSGGGYVAMQLLLSDVTGKPVPQLLDELVLRPIGMTHSTFEEPLPKNLWPSAATPYREDGKPVKGGWHTYPEITPAALWTTPSDIARMAIEVQNEYAGKSNKTLSRGMMHQMLAHQKDDWGLGFALEAPGHKLRFSHGGSNEGFRCTLQAYTEAPGQGIVIMTNGDQGWNLLNEILRAVSKEYSWPDFQPQEHVLTKIDRALLSAYVGKYEVTGAEKPTLVTLKGAHLYVQTDALGPEPQELLPESDAQFFVTSAPLVFDFQKDEKGVISKMILHSDFQTVEAKKVQ
jgi:CubicO group peptidase (beta-lactamase class C family)